MDGEVLGARTVNVDGCCIAKYEERQIIIEGEV
jgi:hypothetical protein